MCNVALAMAGAQFAGSVMQHGAETKNAKKQNYVAAENYIAEEKYKNEVYKQDVEFFGKLLTYNKDEFQRQADIVDKTQTAIKSDYITQLRTLALRSVEEAMSASIQEQEVVRQGRRMGATENVASGERGVTGITASIVTNDIGRQVGESRRMINRNAGAVQRQLNLTAVGLSASADTALANINIQTFQPMQGPTAPGAGAKPQYNPGPSKGALLSSMASSYGTYNQYKTSTSSPSSKASSYYPKSGTTVYWD